MQLYYTRKILTPSCYSTLWFVN